jgi:hypothetical protein
VQRASGYIPTPQPVIARSPHSSCVGAQIGHAITRDCIAR